MNFFDTKTYKTIKVAGFYSLIFNILTIVSFFISYALTFIINDWIAVGWIIPLLVKIVFLYCFCVILAYLMFVIYLEYVVRETNIPFKYIENTDFLIRKISINKFVKVIISLLSLLSFIFDTSLSIINIYISLIGVVILIILIAIYNYKKRK